MTNQNLIEEIVKQRKASIEMDRAFLKAYERVNSRFDRPPLSEAIRRKEDVAIISEIKPASPTLGAININLDVKKVVSEMEAAGAIGLSVLTEPDYFKGSYENLEIAVAQATVPCLMKDFIIDEVQFQLAHILGASNILLINSITDIVKFYSMSQKYCLEPLIEIHESKEIEDIGRLFDAGFDPKLVGVNNRNLKTLKIDLNTSINLIPRLKETFGDDLCVISESGINSVADIRYLQSSGADAFLIGSSIMKSANPGEKILELRGIK